MKRNLPWADDDNDFESIKKTRPKKRQSKAKAKASSALQSNTSNQDLCSRIEKLNPSTAKGSNNEEENSLRCPVCFFPFKYLIGVTQNWHVLECLDRKWGTNRESCPKGLNCDAFSASHYCKYQHYDKQNTHNEIQDNSSKEISIPTPECGTENRTIANPHIQRNGIQIHKITGVEAALPSNKSAKQGDKLKVKESATICSKELFDASIDEIVVDGFHEDLSPNLFSDEDTTNGASVDPGGCSSVSTVASVASDKDNGSLSTPMVNVKKASYESLISKESAKNLKQADIGGFFGTKKGRISVVDVKVKAPEVSTTVTPSSWRWGKGRSSQVSNTEKSSVDSGSIADVREKRQVRSCPFYKKIPDSPFTVDAFRYGEIPGCHCYFLTHFHYDHYGGLTKKFKGKVYCSQVTGNLVISQLRVLPDQVVRLPMDEPTMVHGIKITLLNANHCPGSVLFLFEWPNGKRILHTGDFRADQSMKNYPVLLQKRIDVVYLDTTYCLPYYKFPTQQTTITYAVRKALEYTRRQSQTLVICGSYTIGKERVFHAIAEALDSSVCVRKDKMKVLSCLEWKSLESRLTLDQKKAQVHVLPMNCLTIQYLQSYLADRPYIKQIVAFKPTGWTYTDKNISLDEVKPITRPGISIYGIPYSEHSSYNELEWFIRWLKPTKIIPTVNVGSPEKREEMQRSFREWLS